MLAHSPHHWTVISLAYTLIKCIMHAMLGCLQPHVAVCATVCSPALPANPKCPMVKTVSISHLGRSPLTLKAPDRAGVSDTDLTKPAGCT